MRWCQVWDCSKEATCFVYSKTGKSRVAQYCEEHKHWAIEEGIITEKNFLKEGINRRKQ
jgi:hypothetical protein